MINFLSREYRIKKKARHIYSESKNLFAKNRSKVQPEIAELIKEKLGQVELAINNGNASEIKLRTDELESINKEHLSKFGKSRLRQNIEALLFAVILALLIRTFIIQPFKIRSGSMMSTLLVGDHLLVSKFIYGTKIPFTNNILLPLREIKHGDVIVFKYPNNENDSSKNGVHYIKRVVGLPGDRIDINGRGLIVNGVELPLNFVGDYYDDRFGTRYDKYEEDLLGKKHIVIYEKGRDYTQRGNLPVVVPPGHVFVMGDNRDNSQDSRFWGFVPIHDIEGQAFITHWSWDFDNDNFLNKVRWNRIFSLID
ncbi:MAG: signal peptidase I [Deltaproteobacteria bacterium]|nr:signal peptidase I [Deltaproteobacteria bacterium]